MPRLQETLLVLVVPIAQFANPLEGREDGKGDRKDGLVENPQTTNRFPESSDRIGAPF